MLGVRAGGMGPCGETLSGSAVPPPILLPGTLQSAGLLQGLCPSRGSLDPTRREGLVADSFRCWALAETQDQRSILAFEIFQLLIDSLYLLYLSSKWFLREHVKEERKFEVN